MTSACERLLVVDDEPDLRTLYELTLVREGYDVECAGCVAEAWAALEASPFDVVITDLRLPDGTGLDLLRRLEAAGRSERAIVITAYGSAENAVEALKSGAYDYLTKPVDLKQFRSVVAAAAGRSTASSATGSSALGASPQVSSPGSAQSSGDRSRRSMGSRTTALDRLVGSSAALGHVRELIGRLSRGMAPVLIQGESGTGKEVVARAIHESSTRSGMPFVAVNCGAIPETLLEAEFFGYRKGAFTGATEDRPGFFQAAEGGSLFLDEIGDLPLSMQSKLLRVIQERAVRVLGTAMEVPVDVRIVSATHKDLVQEVAAGRFRQDLYYRLNVIRMVLPPLRERLEDLPELSRNILNRISGEAGVASVPRLAPNALAALARQPFPGNVRELENLLHRAIALAAGDLLDARDLGLEDSPAESAGVAGASRPNPDHTSTSSAKESELVSPAAIAAAASDPLPKDLAAYLDAVERGILERALERHRYNRTAAGASLGLSLRQMRYRMARLGVLSGDPTEAESGA